MRVAQLTFNTYNNYGNVLQKYALQQTLKKFVDFTEVLWFNGNGGTSNFWAENAEIPPNKSLQYYLREAVKMSRFKDFDERYIKTRFNIPYIEDIADEYDFFVVGSDQVWNPKCEPVNMPFSIKFLNFVPREKKIAYAASIGLKEIPAEFVKICAEGMASFNHISVRESNAVDIVKKLTGRDAELVLDPVFMLTPDEWLKVSRRPAWLNEKFERGYILTYFFDNIKLDVVSRLSKKLNLPVINLFDENVFNHYTVGLEEFVYLIANATAIFTNSFHGTAFSILFKRPFVEYIKSGTWVTNVSERITSLLKMFKLEDRIFIPTNILNSPLEIDFSVRDKILPHERLKAFNFLTTALNSKGGDAY